jgi:hypothetical protein
MKAHYAVLFFAPLCIGQRLMSGITTVQDTLGTYNFKLWRVGVNSVAMKTEQYVPCYTRWL